MKPLKKCRDSVEFSILKYFALNSPYPLIMAHFLLINVLRPLLFEEERGNEGVSQFQNI